MTGVSRNQPLDHLPSQTTKPKPVGVPIVSVGDGQVVCSCGWQFYHARIKVLEDRAEAHCKKRHNHPGLWL